MKAQTTITLFFVGRDETGTARYAFLRGTYTRGEPFKAEVPGSDKRFCFLLPPKGKTNRVAVYEAAIEPMAHLTLEGTTDKWRLSPRRHLCAGRRTAART